MKAQLAFYKAEGTIFDKLIRVCTSSKYSHVEIVVEEGDEYAWYSSSSRDHGVRKTYMDKDTDHWDFFDIEIDGNRLLEYYELRKGTGYDYLCIFLTHIIPLGIQSNDKEICSEFCGNVMEFDNSFKYSPEDLYNIIVTR